MKDITIYCWWLFVMLCHCDRTYWIILTLHVICALLLSIMTIFILVKWSGLLLGSWR